MLHVHSQLGDLNTYLEIKCNIFACFTQNKPLGNKTLE